MDIRPVAAGTITPGILGAYERALNAIDCPDFESTVNSALREFVSSSRFYMFDGADGAPVTLRLAQYEPKIAPFVTEFMRDYLPHDPIGDAVKMLSASESVVLKVDPDDVQEGYRERFFRACDMVERVSLVQRTSQGWRCLNISRDRSAGPCSDEEMSRFVAIGQLLLPMVARYATRIAVTSPSRSSIPELERRFAERRPELSNRERQVCARAALGMSVEATALDLDIALTSVLTYRKRAYARLGVSSPYELACIVMN